MNHKLMPGNTIDNYIDKKTGSQKNCLWISRRPSCTRMIFYYISNFLSPSDWPFIGSLITTLPVPRDVKITWALVPRNRVWYPSNNNSGNPNNKKWNTFSLLSERKGAIVGVGHLPYHLSLAAIEGNTFIDFQLGTWLRGTSIHVSLTPLGMWMSKSNSAERVSTLFGSVQRLVLSFAYYLN